MRTIAYGASLSAPKRIGLNEAMTMRKRNPELPHPKKDKVTLSKPLKQNGHILDFYSPDKLKKNNEIKNGVLENSGPNMVEVDRGEDVQPQIESAQNVKDEKYNPANLKNRDVVLGENGNDVDATAFDESKVLEYVEKTIKRVDNRLREGEYESKAFLNYFTEFLMQNLLD